MVLEFLWLSVDGEVWVLEVLSLGEVSGGGWWMWVDGLGFGVWCLGLWLWFFLELSFWNLEFDFLLEGVGGVEMSCVWDGVRFGVWCFCVGVCFWICFGGGVLVVLVVLWGCWCRWFSLW